MDYNKKHTIYELERAFRRYNFNYAVMQVLGYDDKRVYDEFFDGYVGDAQDVLNVLNDYEFPSDLEGIAYVDICLEDTNNESNFDFIIVEPY